MFTRFFTKKVLLYDAIQSEQFENVFFLVAKTHEQMLKRYFGIKERNFMKENQTFYQDTKYLKVGFPSYNCTALNSFDEKRIQRLTMEFVCLQQSFQKRK